MRPLLSLAIVVCYLGLAQDARAALQVTKLADGIAQAQPLSGGRMLVLGDDGEFGQIDLATGARTPWRLDWTPADNGWEPLDSDPVNRAQPNIAVSHDGLTVAVGLNVTALDPDGGEGGASAEGESFGNALFSTAIVLCDADGGHARCAALCEQSDGGPRLYFTQDDHYLVGPDYLSAAPTPDGLRRWYAAIGGMTAAPVNPPNAYDLQRGELASLPALRDATYLAVSPFSDDFYYDEMDTPTLHLGTLAGPQPGLTGRYGVADGEEYFNLPTWVAPGLLLVWKTGQQYLLDLQGQLSPATAGPWVHYARLPDGRSFFSRDGGQSIELGRVDWRSGTVEGAEPCPELARFAMPVDETGWGGRYDNWTALPDGGGVLVNSPGNDESGFYLVRL